MRNCGNLLGCLESKTISAWLPSMGFDWLHSHFAFARPQLKS